MCEAYCASQGRVEAKGQVSAAGVPKRPSLRKAAADRKQVAVKPDSEADSEPTSRAAPEQASAPAAPGPAVPTQSHTSPYSPTAGQAYSPSDAMGAHPFMGCSSRAKTLLSQPYYIVFVAPCSLRVIPFREHSDEKPHLQSTFAAAVAAQTLEGWGSN